MNSKFISVYILMLFAITGCTLGIMESRAAAWNGHSIDELTATNWGVPTASIRRSDGGFVYTYDRHSSGGNICKVTFVTNQGGIIVSTHVGPGCM